MTGVQFSPVELRRRWLSFGLGIGAVLILALLYPPAQSVYNFFSDRNVFYEVFYGKLGVGQNLSEVFAAVAAIVAAFLSAFAYSWGTFKVLYGVGNLTEYAKAMLALVATFVAPQTIVAMGDIVNISPRCFEQGSGAVQRWYVRDATGQIILSNSSGKDGLGRKRLPISPDICEIYSDQQAGKFPRLIEYVPGKTDLFDRTTGTPIIWYSDHGGNDIRLFDYRGNDPATGQPLRPINQSIKQRLDAKFRNKLKIEGRNWSIGVTRVNSSMPFLTERSRTIVVEKIGRCWAPPTDIENFRGETAVVVNLGRSGEAVGTPTVISNSPGQESLAESVVEAIYRCLPFEGLPIIEYPAWRSLVLNFSKKQDDSMYLYGKPKAYSDRLQQ